MRVQLCKMEAKSCVVKFLRFFVILAFLKSIDLLHVYCLSHNNDAISTTPQNTREMCAICNSFNISENARFIELALVIDYQNSFIYPNKNIQFRYDIMDKVNSFFQPFDIFVALVHLEIWNKSTSRIVMSNDIYNMYNTFQEYAKSSLFSNNVDHVQLISLSLGTFDREFLPKEVRTIRMCNSSIGVIRNNDDKADEIANDLIYVLAFNMGIDLDDTSKCSGFFSSSWKDKLKGIANRIFGTPRLISCTKDAITNLVKNEQRLSCLKNQPKSSFNRSVCGNDILEIGEDCDCRLAKNCNSLCCNSTTCKFIGNASCTYGECCDVERCQFKSKDIICRKSLHQCDLAETCDGVKEFCPENKFKKIGEVCVATTPICNGTTTLCSDYDMYHGTCAADGQCECANMSSNRYCPESPSHNSYFYLIIIIASLLGGILFIIYAYRFITRKLCCSQSGNQLRMRAAAPYLVSPINETYSAATSISYHKPSDDIRFQQTTPNQYEEVYSKYDLPPMFSS